MQSRSLVEGSAKRALLTFAIPFLLSNFLQALYGAVDTAIVGWYSNAAGISAVSVGTQVMQIVTSLMTGLSTGGSIMIARYCGEKNDGQVKHTVGTMLIFFSLLSLVLAVLLYAFRLPILTALKTPVESFAMADDYVRICCFGVMFTALYNSLSAILRGMGDSAHPLMFIAIACVANIVLDLLFVGAGMGPAGAALATVLSQVISVVCALVYIKRKTNLFSGGIRFGGKTALQILRLGLPLSLNETMVHLSFLIIAAIVNGMGVTVSAAYGICGKFDGFTMLPAGAFSGAIASFVAQNMGAKKPQRALEGLRAAITYSLIPAVMFFLWAQLSPESILRIFGAQGDVLTAGSAYMRTFSMDFLFVAFAFNLSGFFSGVGHTTYTLLQGLLSTFLFRVPLSYLLGTMGGGSFSAIGLAAPAASLASIIMAVFYWRYVRRHGLMLTKEATEAV